MFHFPAMPELPAEQRARGPMSLRYEDIAQDGRLLVGSIPHGLGEVMWQRLLAEHAMRERMTADGIVPILTRMIVEATGWPIAARPGLDGEGAFQLAHTVDERGEVNRLVMNMWFDAYGPRGTTYGPPPAGAGERIHVGRAFAEHVFTRLFAPPDRRKVLRLPLDGPLAVPPDRYAWKPPEQLLELPPDAAPLDPDLLPDSAPLALGLGHTDANQHVNAMVYPSYFEQAALRRFDHHGRATNIKSRFAELAYRKPSFAGERVRFRLRAFAWRDQLGAVGGLFDDKSADPRPRCWVRMLFEK